MGKNKDKKDIVHNCDCDKDCTCGCQEGKPCTCEDENCCCQENMCNCEDNCDEGCGCHIENNSCECDEQTEDNCECENCEEECECHNQKDLAEEYLTLLKIVQADFDNYRKRSDAQIERARIDGISSTANVLLPSLDAFAKVKKDIKDETLLQGIEMLERQILSGFEKLGIEKIEAVGQQLNPNLHNALAVAKDETKPDGEILTEFQAGYKMGDKIIRYSQVVVNKL